MKRLIALLITMTVIFSFIPYGKDDPFVKEEAPAAENSSVTTKAEKAPETSATPEKDGTTEKGPSVTTTKKKGTAAQDAPIGTQKPTTTTKAPQGNQTSQGNSGTVQKPVRDYPSAFSVGYGTVDISGNPAANPITYYGGTATGVHDPLLLTCIAIWDGETIALVMTADLKKMLEPVADRSFEIIEEKFDIPEKNVIISCTHTHAAPDAGAGGNGNAQWLENYYEQLPVAVEKALDDLDPVVGVFTGKADQPGIGFVRRYLLENGTYKMNPSASDRPVAHESVADPEMRTVRFDRQNKKDVLLVNFQTHYYGADTKYPNHFSADFVAPFRESAQREFNCLFAYYSGASGDINQIARLPSDNKVPDADAAFMNAARNCLKSEQIVSMGKIKIQHSVYFAECKINSPERLNQAREVSAGRVSPATYGFVCKDEATYAVYYGDSQPNKAVPFTAITFGDIAFVSAAYEMFHQNAQDVRAASPFKTTFVCTLAHAANGYVPTAIGYAHGGYETWNCRFVAGSGELFANEMIRLLRACK